MKHLLKLATCAAIIIGSASSAFASEKILPVPAATIHMGDVIEEDMLKDRTYPAEARFRVQVAESSRFLVGKVAKRTLAPGEPVPLSAVEQKKVVSRGVPTSIIFQEGGLSISGIGIPSQNGVVGQMIQVKNIDSGRMIIGRVLEDGTIKVGTN